jgi:NADH:ubiquinone oxidoreductase subunit 2 (subunit N)
MDANLWRLCVILVLTTVISYAYYLKLAWYAWMKEPAKGDAGPLMQTPLPMRLALIAGTVVVLWLGLFPGPALELARESVAGLRTIGEVVLPAD